jgi:isopenicillin N synthase-like dioxygenase
MADRVHLVFVDGSLQIVKYPTRDEVASEQGVGPHFDAGFLTFVSSRPSSVNS